MLAKMGHVGSGVVHGIERAKPAIAVGMTALGVAGGIAYRRRQRTVLGVVVPRKPDGVDIIALSKAIGKGSLHVSQTARNISKDIDQAAERAEKIGKILS
jgi:hypothetical protein